MSTRKMRGPFGRRSVAFVVFAVAIAAAGLVWAHWFTSLNVDANINTGNVGIQWEYIWTNDDGNVDGWDGNDNHDETIYERFGDDSSADPSDFGDARYDKDVARCSAGGGGEGIWIDIENGYPSYHCTAQTAIHNYGSVPIKAMPSNYEVMKGWNECGWWYEYDESSNWFSNMTPYDVRNYEYATDDWRPYVERGNGAYDPNAYDAGYDWLILWDDVDGFEYVDLDYSADFTAGDEVVFNGCNFYGDYLAVEDYGGGGFAWGYYDEFDNFHPEITGQMPTLFGCGTQIDPEYWEDAQFNFHIEQEAEQNATYRFSAHQEFVNWNEFDDGWCEGGGVVVEDGAPAHDKGFGVRYRSFANTGGEEIYLGVGDLGVAANRNAVNLTWGSAQHVAFAYDGAGNLSAAVDGVEQVSYSGVTPSCAEFLVMSVVARDADTSVDFNNVHVNGMGIGDFHAQADPDEWNVWTISGIDFASAFTVEGDLLLDGSFSISQENNKVELLVACPIP